MGTLSYIANRWYAMHITLSTVECSTVANFQNILNKASGFHNPLIM